MNLGEPSGKVAVNANLNVPVPVHVAVLSHLGKLALLLVALPVPPQSQEKIKQRLTSASSLLGQTYFWPL